MNQALSPLLRWTDSRARLSAVARFESSPAEYMRAERREGVFGAGMAEHLWRSERACRHLSLAMRRQLEEACNGLELDRPEWRLALLSVARLDRLAAHVAALVVASEVRRTLSREEVCAWRDWLRPDAYEFAQTVAGLMPMLMVAPGLAGWRRFSSVDVGWCWLARVSAEWPSGIRARFALKQPVLPETCVCPQDAAAARRVVQAVMLIVESQWCSSFATRRK